MPELATVAQAVQIGVETTAGTTVSASKLLNSIGFEPGINFEATTFRPIGQKYPSQVVPNREWMSWTVSGVPSYGEMVYPLNSVLVHSTASTSDTSAKIWTFTPAARTEDTVDTFTMEMGSSTRAFRSVYALFSDYTLTFERTALSHGGSVISQRLLDGVTLTATPTAVEEKPIIPTHCDFFIDTTSGGIGGTKMTRAFRVAVNFQNRFNPVWPLNSAVTGYASHVEIEPNFGIEWLLEADATGMGFLTTQARAGTTVFIRTKATSTELAGAATLPYSLQIDAAVKIDTVGNPRTDQEGVACIPYTGRIVYDASWGKAVEVKVTNKVAAL